VTQVVEPNADDDEWVDGKEELGRWGMEDVECVTRKVEERSGKESKAKGYRMD
jgi:hypothetical protein